MKQGRIKAVELLISLGAKLDFVDLSNQTPLFYAVRYQQLEMVKFLHSQGASLEYKDVAGKTVMDYAK